MHWLTGLINVFKCITYSGVNNTYLENCLFLLILYSRSDSLCIALRLFFGSLEHLSHNIMWKTGLWLKTNCPCMGASGCFAEAGFATSWGEGSEVLGVWWETSGLHKQRGESVNARGYRPGFEADRGRPCGGRMVLFIMPNCLPLHTSPILLSPSTDVRGRRRHKPPKAAEKPPDWFLRPSTRGQYVIKRQCEVSPLSQVRHLDISTWTSVYINH